MPVRLTTCFIALKTETISILPWLIMYQRSSWTDVDNAYAYNRTDSLHNYKMSLSSIVYMYINAFDPDYQS